jgi:hypothetical protein
VWLNLVCLDAPLVAIAWQWLFARSFGVAVGIGATLALFLTAWLIYLADRFGDSLSIDLTRSTALRQRFCLRHRRVWRAAIVCVALADCAVIFLFLTGTSWCLVPSLGCARSFTWPSIGCGRKPGESSR